MNEPTPQPIESGAVDIGNDNRFYRTKETAYGFDLVAAALVATQGAVKPAEFDATNPFFKSKYATLGSVIEASRAALLKNGLAILQKPSIADHTVTLHTLIVHTSGQTLDGGTMSLPLGENDRNSDAQLAGSIITYLKRYAWASVLGIYADQDTDGNDAPRGAASQRPPSTGTEPARTAPSPVSGSPKPTVATDKHRLKALNNLLAAPGQPNVGLVEGYLRSKLWITGEQTVMDFPLEFVPTDKEEMEALKAAVERFEVTQREQVSQ